MIPMKPALPRLCLAVAASLWLTNAGAQNQTERAERWEASFHILQTDSETVNGENSASANIDSGVGWGFGFGYNFNDHLGLDFNFGWRETDYQATTTPDAGNGNGAQTFSGTLDVGTFAVNGVYNMLAKSLTPFVTGGVGATYVNTDIPDGLPVNVCWWDPWWGYYCGPVVPTKSETYFSYNVGAGVRWDSKGSLFLRGLVSQQWIDVGGAVGTPSFVQYRFDIGARF